MTNHAKKFPYSLRARGMPRFESSETLLRSSPKFSRGFGKAIGERSEGWTWVGASGLVDLAIDEREKKSRRKKSSEVQKICLLASGSLGGPESDRFSAKARNLSACFSQRFRTSSLTALVSSSVSGGDRSSGLSGVSSWEYSDGDDDAVRDPLPAESSVTSSKRGVARLRVSVRVGSEGSNVHRYLFLRGDLLGGALLEPAKHQLIWAGKVVERNDSIGKRKRQEKTKLHIRGFEPPTRGTGLRIHSNAACELTSVRWGGRSGQHVRRLDLICLLRQCQSGGGVGQLEEVANRSEILCRIRPAEASATPPRINYVTSRHLFNTVD
ncbi:hypothetical protein B0H13DRAFT_1864675 [Mycena leptocephala]|nr:hypothetical protein B0H13DRAFT_1864675 [Mycena leptocephala]